MRTFYAKSLIASSLLPLWLYGAGECKEIEKELQKLRMLKKMVQQELATNKKLLEQIRQERQALKELNASIQKEIETIQSQRIKKLAKDFESMDPEYAGEKLSKMKNLTIAAYILYNMNSRKAGEALNFVTPKALSTITQILTKLKNDEKKK